MSLIRYVSPAALTNAWRSAEEIRRSVSERRLLQEQLDRPHAPGDLGALDEAECRQLLGSRSVGRLAYIARAGVPDLVPVNYHVHDGDVLIRSGHGPKLQAAQRHEVVAFEVDDIDEDRHAGWSVVLVGRLSVASAHGLPDAVLPQPWAGGPRTNLMRLHPRRVTGRRLTGQSRCDS